MMNARQRSALKPYLAIAALALLLGSLLVVFSAQRDHSDFVAGELNAADNRSATTPLSPDSSQEERTEAVAIGGPPAASSQSTAENLAGQNGESDAARNLRAAVEATLVGHLDIDSILHIATEIASLEVDPHANPVPHPTGRIEFPILDTPKGMEATLAVARSRNFKEVLTLVIKMDTPLEPYLLEGAVRNAPSVEITSWFGGDGELQHFGILTAVHANSLTTDYGLSLDYGEVPEALSFNISMSSPLDWKATQKGIINGSPGDLDRPVIAAPDPASRLEQMGALGDQLLRTRRSLDRK